MRDYFQIILKNLKEINEKGSIYIDPCRNMKSPMDLFHMYI
jgi:hypothetical protein